jgi:hypothetical protein
MATTTINIQVADDLLEANPSSVPIVPGDSIVLNAPASVGARLCMTAATAALFTSSTTVVAAGSSATLQFAASASGSHSIGLVSSEFSCPLNIQPGAGNGMLSFYSATPGFEGPGDDTESGTKC